MQRLQWHCTLRMMHECITCSVGCSWIGDCPLICEMACYMQNSLNARPRMSFMAQAVSGPSAFQVQIYFHGFMVLEEYIRTKFFSTVCKYSSGMHMGYAVQLMIKTWNACTWHVEYRAFKLRYNLTSSTITAQ